MLAEKYEFMRAAVATCDTLGSLNCTSALSHCSEGQKPGIRALPGWVPSEAVRQDLFHASSQASGGLLALGVPWLMDMSPDLGLYLHISLYLSLCVCVLCFYKDTSHIGVQPTLKSSF